MCPVCKYTKIKEVIDEYNRCAKCYSLYVNYFPQDREINQRIEHWGNNFARNLEQLPISETSLARATLLRQYAPEKSKLIDVGCGNGDFLKAAREAQFELSAMDKSRAIVKYIRSQGITSHESLSNIKPYSFDIVTCFDVIEHTLDPNALLVEIKRILKKNGLLMLTTPNICGISAVLLKKRWWVLGPQDHLVLFNPHSIKQLIEKVGFTTIDVQTDTFTQWCRLGNVILSKVLNKILYLGHLPFKNYLFANKLGDNIQILARNF